MLSTSTTSFKPPRRCLVLCGPQDWSWSLAQSLCGPEALWIGDQTPPGVQGCNPLDVRHWLGRELSLVVFDCWQGLDPDALAAICGCIKAGGALVLLTPELQEWPALADPWLERIGIETKPQKSHFLTRLARLLTEAPEVELVGPGDAPHELPLPKSPSTETKDHQLTPDQSVALEALLHLARGRARRPLMLSADRGRGKSSLLGHAAARLLDEGLGSILVTAAHPQMLTSLFAEAQRLLPTASRNGHRLSYQDNALRFVPADELLRNQYEARLLLVDEAAALPLAMLEKLLDRYGRIAFASTTQGYEGSGRGFLLRFAEYLNTRWPGWRQMELDTPIRWARNDPLEQLLYHLLLLDAEPELPEEIGQIEIKRLEPELLAGNEPLLRQVFGLLRGAHYQTRPSDLRRLLDQPGLVILALLEQGLVTGLLMAIAEGGFTPELAEQIHLGLRRPRGHLLPQSLSTHAGFREAASLRYLRVSRIAIHPKRQRQGFGSLLLKALEKQSQGLDFLGTSFAANPELIRFWFKNAWLPVRLGYRPEAASGQHSLQLLKPLSATAKTLWPGWRARFDESFVMQLGDPLRDLDPAIAAPLIYPEGKAPALSAQDRDDLIAFCQGRRDYGGARLALWRLTCLCAHKSPPEALIALILKVLEARDWNECAGFLGLTGRRAVVQRLRDDVASLLENDRQLFPQGKVDITLRYH